MARTATIRVPESAKQEFAEVAKEMGLPQSKAFVRILREYRRDLFFRQLAQAASELRADPVASKEYDDEFKLWDATLSDGTEGY
jgi:hypothetical protein